MLFVLFLGPQIVFYIRVRITARVIIGGASKFVSVLADSAISKETVHSVDSVRITVGEKIFQTAAMTE